MFYNWFQVRQPLLPFMSAALTVKYTGGCSFKLEESTRKNYRSPSTAAADPPWMGRLVTMVVDRLKEEKEGNMGDNL